MGNFFNGWRRKIGVVTLGMACVVLSLWMRTIDMFDQLKIPNDEPSSYLFIVLSLTGLSAWLLLSKPQLTQPATASDSNLNAE